MELWVVLAVVGLWCCGGCCKLFRLTDKITLDVLRSHTLREDLLTTTHPRAQEHPHTILMRSAGGSWSGPADRTFLHDDFTTIADSCSRRFFLLQLFTILLLDTPTHTLL